MVCSMEPGKACLDLTVGEGEGRSRSRRDLSACPRSLFEGAGEIAHGAAFPVDPDAIVCSAAAERDRLDGAWRHTITGVVATTQSSHLSFQLVESCLQAVDLSVFALRRRGWA